ncbi:hypothetical protein D3C87_1499320 [compost metagenome]
MGEGVLEAGVDRQAQAVSQGEARVAADVAGVRRVDTGLVRTRDVGRTRVALPVLELRQRDLLVAEEVTVFVVVTRQADEVAVVAQRLVDAAIVLGLVDAEQGVEVIIFGLRGRKPGRSAPRAELTGVDHGEDAAEALIASRGDQAHAEVRRRTTGHHVDGAAGGRGGRAIDLGGAQIHTDARQGFRVGLLVGVDGVVAGVVQRNAVDGQ